MNTELIRSKSVEVDSARALLKKLNEELALIDMRRGQDCCAISCAGRVLSVTAFNGDRSYMPRLRRGMEMVQLGLRKYWQAMIDSQQEVVAQKEIELKAATEPTAAASLKLVA